MSYSSALEDFILSLKGGVFFLSPRERLFLNFLQDMGVPERVVRSAVERCYTAIPPEKRSKYPLFLCMNRVMEEYENFLRLEAQKLRLDWRERFNEKVSYVAKFIKVKVKEPESEEEAQRILLELENSLLRELWRSMSREERERIREKFKEFKDNRELFGELIKREVQKKFCLPRLSLYVD